MPPTAAQIALVNDLKKIRKAAYTNSQLQLYTVRFWSQFTDAQMGRLQNFVREICKSHSSKHKKKSTSSVKTLAVKS